MKKNEGYLGRGLHTDKLLKAFDKGGKLKPLLDLIIADEDLVLGIRNDYVNVYYKGGNMAKIESENSIQFDSNYYKGYNYPQYIGDAKETDRKKQKNNVLSNLRKGRDYRLFIDTMKSLMNQYWDWLEKVQGKSLQEKNTQHKLCISNSADSEYTIIDVEFQISTICNYSYKTPEKVKGRDVNTEKKSPRFDIIAVRNSDHQLCVIELKSGINAISGKSGIGDHADSFEGTIGRNYEPFFEEINNIVKWKKDHGLLPSDFVLEKNKPEFLYAYEFKENNYYLGELLTYERQKEMFITKLHEQSSQKYRVIFLERNSLKLKNAQWYLYANNHS